MIKYSIIIPTYKNLNNCLIPCVESIIKYTDFSDCEIIIVANGCGNDGTREYIESLGIPFKLIWFNNPLGYTRATNEGIKVSRGQYIVFLNNDTVLLEQPKNLWLDLLVEPFCKNSNVGVTGPVKMKHAVTSREFIIFFCAMTTRKLIEEVGLLDEIFSPGYGEDIDFCLKVENKGYLLERIPFQDKLHIDNNMWVSHFPIYHVAEKTVNTLDDWNKIIERNNFLLYNRYQNKNIDNYSNKKTHQELLGNFEKNAYERLVIGKNDEIRGVQSLRYRWAQAHLVGKKILDLGCSSGYGLRFLENVKNLDYTGIDRDKNVIDFAIDNFGDIAGVKFLVQDINSFNFDYYDTIIAFEIIEHLENGLEILEEIKHHCDCCLVSVTYNEPHWANHHHKLSGLTAEKFEGFECCYGDNEGNLSTVPTSKTCSILGKWEKKQIDSPSLENGGKYESAHIEIKDSVLITAEVSTKDRYFTTLPLCLSAIINQSYKIKELLIFDDGEHLDLRNNPLYSHIFSLILRKQIDWKFIFGEKKGQVLNHQKAIELAKYDFIYRCDDDEIPEPTCIENLVKLIHDPQVGAVGGLVYDPTVNIMKNKNARNNIDQIYNEPNIQWLCHDDKTPIEVEHLYSTFLYKKKAAKHGYCMQLSPAGHREETIFTYLMHKEGWKLLVNPEAITWHFRYKEGGIRSFNDHSYWEHDEQIFKKIINHTNSDKKIFVLNNGLGDHIVFKMLLPEIKKKFKDFVLAVCYREVFEDEDIELISLNDATQILGDIERYSIYRFMQNYEVCNGEVWNKPLIDAYRELYGI